MKQIAQSLETFIEAGLLERIQNPMHAARMYLLEPDGPKSGDFKELLESASTRQGRGSILKALKSGRPTAEGCAQDLRLVKRASARG